jgi:hypothetical protein
MSYDANREQKREELAGGRTKRKTAKKKTESDSLYSFFWAIIMQISHNYANFWKILE